MKSNYEQARDEAAHLYAKDCETCALYAVNGFADGADWHRSYEQQSCDTKIKTLDTVHGKEIADLLTDNKLMKETLKFYSLKSNYSLIDEGRNYDVDYKCYELNETTYADEELGTKARQTLSQLKGKYDE